MANGAASRSSRRRAPVQEFRVGTASFDAAEGHTAGAEVNVTLKSGTNALKGESYYYLRDDKWSATDFFVNKSGGTKPEPSYNRFGGQRRRALLRDRTFFFGAIEWLYDEFPEPGPRTVPTEAMRNGIFPRCWRRGSIIYDPLSAQPGTRRVVRPPFPNNVIPQNRINPIAAARC